MINANELRKGNIVECPFIGIIKTIEQENCFIVPLQDGFLPQQTSFDLIFPIPLTTEILEKFGFTKKIGTPANSKAVYFDIFDDTYRVYLGEYISIHLNAVDWFPELKRFEFLHQFQNIIFWLTDEELEIKSLL